MKKIFFTVIITVLTITSINAQERGQGDIELTPYIGYSSYFHNGESVQGLTPRTSARFGVNGDYYFNDRWSLKSGLNYDPMGVVAGSDELKSDYLSVPINANWHFGSIRKWNLNFGVTPSFLLSGEVNGTDIKKYMNTFQLGISYGIGYKLEVTDSFSLLLDTQGFVGFNEIYKESNSLKRMNAGSSFNIGGVFVF